MMKRLTGDTLFASPHVWGFLELPFEGFAEGLIATRFQISIVDTMKRERVEGCLERLLARLEEPPSLSSRYLFTETQSSWTALFANPFAPSETIMYLAKMIPCRGLVVGCFEHTYNPTTKTGVAGGGVHLTLYGADARPMPERDIGISFDDLRNEWSFEQYGEPLPFERVDLYSAASIPSRFTCEVLEEYCCALGIRLFDQDFYGPRGLLLRRRYQQ